MNKLIAFRSVDPEGDVWCEDALLFYTDKDVVNFFKEDNKDLISIFTEEDSPILENFTIYNDTPSERIYKVTFTTEYAGDVEIVEMSDGYIIHY